MILGDNTYYCTPRILFMVKLFTLITCFYISIGGASIDDYILCYHLLDHLCYSKDLPFSIVVHANTTVVTATNKYHYR